jgi:hypothetical protein
LIIATHSEVLVDGTSPDQVISFYGSPHPLLADVERDQVREALKRLTAMDILLAEEAPGVLYVESESDFNLLSAWAQVLNHQPICQWLAQSPYWHSNQGCHPREARDHFFALRAIKPQMKGYLLLDGDNRGLADREIRADGLVIGRWKRYETESYLIHPEALRRYVEEINTPLFASAGMEYLRDELPGAVLRDPLGDHDYLKSNACQQDFASRFLQGSASSFVKERLLFSC